MEKTTSENFNKAIQHQIDGKRASLQIIFQKFHLIFNNEIIDHTIKINSDNI